MPCEVNLEKNGFPIESSDQIAKDEEFSDEKFTNDLTQELKFVGQQMSYDFIFGEWQESAKESMDMNKPLDSMFLFEDKAYENWWMSNQVSIIVFEIEHPFWICGSIQPLIWNSKFNHLKFRNQPFEQRNEVQFESTKQPLVNNSKSQTTLEVLKP
jgi:hypothetical protein